MKHAEPQQVKEAEKKVGAVLEQLESDTDGDVKDIGLEDMVDTDPQSGRPVVKKAVDIKIAQKPQKRWST